jgi:serine/threonine-protein kinase
MELVQGPSMAEFIESRGPMPEARALELVLQATRALGAMHRHGIVHRDVKPANLLLEMQGTEPKRVKVADLGFARVPGKRITQEGKTMGTGSYMAPEQVVGEAVDARTDVYGLGITLYYALTAERPFAGTQGEVMCWQLLVEAPPPSTLQPTISAAADELVAIALRKHPGNRYQSMAAMRDDIERALSGKRLEGVAPVREPDAFTPESELGARVMEVLRGQYL